MKRLIASLALSLAVLSASADEALGPEAFADYALGWTLYFERDGQPWGAEEFRPDGSVRWQFPNGECSDGIWRPYEGAVCFSYEGAFEILCWEMRRAEGRGTIIGTLLGEGEDAGLELEIVRRDKRPLTCVGEGTDT